MHKKRQTNMYRLGVFLLLIGGLNACGKSDIDTQQKDPWAISNNKSTPADMSPDLGKDMASDQGPDLEPFRAPTGDACDVGDACIGGDCKTDPGWVDGYCTQEACRNDQDCSDSSGRCMRGDAGIQDSFCVKECTSQRDCRTGYSCQEVEDGNYSACLPAVVEPQGSADAEACDGDRDCAGGTCIPDADGWPDGYCTTLQCETRDDCARGANDQFDNRCLRNQQGPNLCVRICDTNTDCREGYLCEDIGQGQGICVPGVEITIGEDFDQYPFPITCGLQANQNGQISYDYDIKPDTTSYMVTPLAKDLERLVPTNITTGDDATMLLDFRQQQFQAATSQFFGFINPTLLPGAPQFADQVVTGKHTYNLRTNSSDICFYKVEEATDGVEIDVNIYLVGVPNITASGAPTNTNMQTLLQSFDDIYANAGIKLGKVRYFDVTGAEAQQYSVIRDEDALTQLTTLSKLPGPTRDDALSLNIFFVRSFAMQGGAIGVSLGLPGPAGLHSTPASGVVFTSEFLGRQIQDGSTGQTVDGNKYTGIVMAHEIGHYLGLFHTTETDGSSSEPLMDTPTCPRQSFPSNCPDLNNLMFPLAGITHTTLTQDQSSVILANPLSKD